MKHEANYDWAHAMEKDYGRDGYDAGDCGMDRHDADC